MCQVKSEVPPFGQRFRALLTHPEADSADRRVDGSRNQPRDHLSAPWGFSEDGGPLRPEGRFPVIGNRPNRLKQLVQALKPTESAKRGRVDNRAPTNRATRLVRAQMIDAASSAREFPGFLV